MIVWLIFGELIVNTLILNIIPKCWKTILLLKMYNYGCNVCLGAIRVDDQQAKLDELEKIVEEMRS